MYVSVRLERYWSHVTNDIHGTVHDFLKRDKSRDPKKHQRHITISSMNGPMKFIAVDFLGPLLRKKNVN